MCFGYDAKTRKYLTPQLAGTTRLKRSGSEINPFWPMPYKGKGTIGAAKFASKITTSEGFKLSLFRYPEDASPTEHKDSKPTTSSRTQKTR